MIIQETYYLKPDVIETVNILNGDFESWNDSTLNDWETSGTVMQRDGHTGSGVMLYRNGSISQTCKISGGHQYRLTAWLEGTTSYTSTLINVSISFDHGDRVKFNGSGKNTWAASGWTFRVPDDATEATFLFEEAMYSQAFIDDVSCVLVE